jgi:PadR family transcriptional regulator, regulatory protein PadR
LRFLYLFYNVEHMTEVAGLELSVLLAVARLADDAYGLAVRQEVSKRLDREYSVGAIYTTLERLKEKGLLAARMAAPTPTRGGRARRHFRVTSAGAKALEAARHRASMQWMGVISPTAPEAT